MPHLLRLGHVLPGCDLIGMEPLITLFTDNPVPLMSLPPSWFYEPEHEVIAPPREPSGPDNEPEPKDEPSENGSGLPDHYQVEEEIDSNLAFLNPLEQREPDLYTAYRPSALCSDPMVLYPDLYTNQLD